LKILNSARNTILAEHAQLADTFVSRMVGLLKHNHLSQGEGLVITRCQQIHMFFMRFPIDAIFINAKDEVIGLVEHIRPWQLSPIFWNATRVIELPSGKIAQSKTVKGDRLHFSY
jgi:uncharacterized membrane protein (UPF0127 family)